MKSALHRHWPLMVALGALWITVAVVLSICLKQDQGHLVYVIDDPYIHMTIARNLAQHGVWGVSPNEFSSSTSSILWPILLAAVYLFSGPSVAVPLILNILSATLAIGVAYAILYRFGLGSGYLLLFLLWFLFLTPLPAIVFVGMEHTLQTAVAIAFVFLAARQLAADGKESFPRATTWLCLLAGLLTAIRYEGLFLVLPVCLLFAARRRWLPMLSVGVAALIPISVFGLVSLAKGWYLLPNPIWLKANIPAAMRAEGIAPQNYGSLHWSARTVAVLSLGIALILLFAYRLSRIRKFWDVRLVMTAIALMAGVLHLKFAALGWFYRYDAYLIGLGSLLLAALAHDYISLGERRERDRRATLEAAGAVLLILLPYTFLVARGRASLSSIPQASKNTYEQQYQMGRFVREFYSGSVVAANDIGCLSFMGNSRLVDLLGLANAEVARARTRNPLQTEDVDRLVRSEGAKIAIIHPRRYEHGNIAHGGVPPSWIEVGRWTIQNNIASDDDRVAFYAVDPADAERLTDHLRHFASQLPKDVLQSGRYRE